IFGGKQSIKIELDSQHLNVKSIIVAVPCSATDCIEDISKSVDKVICLTTPDD
ncbi:unnamed protein product, partial [Rotaria sp. Silwood1]